MTTSSFSELSSASSKSSSESSQSLSSLSSESSSVFQDYEVNAVTNGGAEAGNLDGWTVVSGDWQVANGSTPGGTAPYDGAWCFYAGEASSGEIRQDINLNNNASDIDAFLVTYDFDAYCRNVGGNDMLRAVLEFRDTNSVVLSTFDTGYQTFDGYWHHVTATGLVPQSARYARIKFLSSRVSAPQCNVYFDATSLVFHKVS